MKKILFLILISIVFISAKAQNWQDSYNTFMQDLQSQNFQKAIESGNKTLQLIGKKDTNYMQVLRYVAYCYYGLQQNDKAVEKYAETRTLCDSLLGNKNYDYLQITYNLAVNYTYIKKYSLAYPLMEEVMNFIVADQGKNSTDFITIGSQQANIYSLAGSYDKAEEIYTDIFNVVKENYKKSDSMYMAMVNIIAPFYFQHGMYDKAEPFYVDAADLMDKIYGKLSPNYMESYNSLGEFYLRGGMYEKSEKVYFDFVGLAEKFYGKNTADYATALNNLAVTYEKQNKNKEAEETYKECLKIKEKVYKKESAYYALTLSNFAVLYDNMARYEEAGKLLEEAVGIYKKIYGEKDPNYAIALNNLASVYSSGGKYKDAIALTQKAMDIQKTLYGEKYDGYLSSLNNLALMYEQTGDYNSAETSFEKCVALRKELQGESHAEYAVSLYNLANIKTLKGEYSQAEKMLNKILDVQKSTQGELTPAYANTLNSLAGLYSTIGNYQLAGETYEHCRTLFLKLYGDMHPEYATFMNNLGLYYYESGNYDAAEIALRKSLNIAYNAFGKDHPDNVNQLSNLANVMMAKGNNKMAEQYMLESVRITKEVLGTSHADYATAMLGLGVLYYHIGNYTKSESCYQEALAKYETIFGKKSARYSTALNNLATLYLSMAIASRNKNEQIKLNDKAAEYFLQAIAIDSATTGTAHPDYAMHLNNLAELYRNTDQFFKAEPLYLKCIEVEKKVFGENNPTLAVTYHNLSLLYNGANMLDKAEEYATKALKMKKAIYGDNSPVLTETIFSLAYIYECKKNYTEAASWYSQGLQLNRDQIKSNFSFLSEGEKSNYLKSISNYDDMLASFTMKCKSSDPVAVAKMFNNELLHKGLLLRSTGQMKNTILNGKDEALKNKYIEWTGLRQELARLYSLPVNARYDSTKILEEKANLLEKELVSKSAALNAGNEIYRRDWVSVQKNLKSNEAAIEFVKYTPSPIPGETTDEGSVYAALVVRPGYKQPEMISLCAEQKLLNLMQNSGGNKGEFIAGLYTRGAGISATKKIPIADSLYALVWKPMLSTLSGATTLYYSPAGLLHQISFPAIPNEKSELLCDLYDLRCVSSTSVLAEKNRKSGKPGSICLFGGIAYDADSVKLKKLSKQYRSGDETEIASLSTESNTRGSSWSYLPGTLTEVKDIYALADKNKISTKLYAGENATEECFKSFTALGSADVIHFATHGFFFPDPDKTEKHSNAQSIYRTNEDPLFRSGLLMAGANNTWKGKPVSGIEDGILTAYEVSNVNLENTRLVVLSACETGLGDIKGSEGVYGLQRAFKMAGVEYIIMSLWQVPDKETAEFMNLFYTNWFQNGDIRAAFSQTQRAMRKKYSAFFWAGFVLVE